MSPLYNTYHISEPKKLWGPSNTQNKKEPTEEHTIAYACNTCVSSTGSCVNSVTGPQCLFRPSPTVWRLIVCPQHEIEMSSYTKTINPRVYRPLRSRHGAKTDASLSMIQKKRSSRFLEAESSAANARSQCLMIEWGKKAAVGVLWRWHSGGNLVRKRVNGPIKKITMSR